MKKIKLICFDLDDTLWSTKQVMMHAEQKAYQLLADKAPALTEQYDVFALFEARVKKWKNLIAQHKSLTHQISQLRQQSLALVLQDHGHSIDESTTISADVFECFMHWRHQPVYFDDAIATLEILADSFKLAAITNGNACTTRLGLDHLFNLHVSAEQLGIGKPEPEPFLHTLEHFNIASDEALHIGDNPSDDIVGARQVGLHTLWYNPKNKPWSNNDIRPCLEVDELQKIPAAVNGLQAKLQMKR